MPAFGYSNRVVNEYGLHELSEVTFDLPLLDLRRIAAFLLDCADAAESGKWQNSHRHIQDHDPTWSECDVIAIHPSAEPPAVSS